METAILLGIPSSYVSRLKHAFIQHGAPSESWRFLFVPAPKKSPEINHSAALQAREFADREANPHVFGFSIQKQRAEWARMIAPYFRFRWCDPLVQVLACLATPDPTPFLERLAVDLAEEALWASRIRPADVASPLLLPESSFGAAGVHGQLWRHARSYGDPANVASAAKAMREFERMYLQKQEQYQWVDERKLVFGRHGQRHAAAPFPRGWKYSFRLPDGFHYDVTHLRASAFSVTDAIGTSHRRPANGYINMDPHGYVRD